MFRYTTIYVALCMCVWYAQAQDQPYCNARYERLCQGKGPHVACQYPYRGVGEACENYTAIIFSNNLKRFVLHYINRRRQRIAAGHERVRGGARLPKPEIMMMVQWDRELAFLAQRLADQCHFVHDDCRATVRYPYAGQTVGEVRWRRSGSLENGARRVIARVFDAWWGERRRVQPKQLISPFSLTSRGAVWGHFSQLTVWTLRAMGCGAVHHGSTRPRLLLVCDFSHTNMLGQRTISPGPLAPCPQHTVRIQQSAYPLLCAPVRDVQAVKDYGDHDVDDEEDDEDDDGEYQETTEAPKRRKHTTKTDVVFSTRPWPDRPVRPLQNFTAEIDPRLPSNLENFDDQGLKDHEDIIYRDSQSMNKKYGEMDIESQTIIRPNYAQKLGKISQTVSSNYFQRGDLNEKGEEDSLNHGNEDIDRKTNRQKYEYGKGINNPANSGNGDPDKDLASIRRYDALNMNRRQGSAKEISDTDNSMITKYNRDEIIRPVKPITKHFHDASLETEIAHHDKKPIKPLQDELIKTDRRPVKPISEIIQSPRRPVLPIGKENEKIEEKEEYEDDDNHDEDGQDDIPEKEITKTWRSNIIKSTEREIDEIITEVSVRYRDEPRAGEVRQSLDRELNQKSKNRKHEKNIDAIHRQKVTNSRNRDSNARNGDKRLKNEDTVTKDRNSKPRNNAQIRGPGIINRGTNMRYKIQTNQDIFRNKDPDYRDPISRNWDQETIRNTDRSRHETARNQDEELKNKAVHKIDNYKRYESMRKGEYKARNGYDKDLDLSYRILDQWREQRNREEDSQRVLPLLKHGKTTRSELTTVVVYRPTSLFSISTDPVMRSRFKQTRVRPKRPGANALLQTSTANYLVRRQSKASLLLDKDDQEQLYQDTGFKLSTLK